MKTHTKILGVVSLIAILTVVIYACNKEKDLSNISETPNLGNNGHEEEQCLYTPEITRENIDKMICFYYDEYVQTHKSNEPGFFERVWKWLIAHTGRNEFFPNENCPYSNPCGPCPGICLNARDGEVFGAVSDDYLLSKSEYEDGIRLFQAALFNDSIMGLSFMQSCFVAADGNFYIPEDFSIGSQAAATFGKNEIIILQGIYPVSNAYTQNGTTLVKVQTF